MVRKISHFAIWIVSPDNYIHSDCFEEVALCLQQSLQEIGHISAIIREPDFMGADTIIVLGGHLMSPGWNYTGTGKLIFYNLEQPQAFTEHYLELLSNHSVWDYSGSNIAAMQSLGINARHCEIGYMPALTRIENRPPEKMDIDVLFYGSLNERRQVIIKELLQRGIMTVPLFGVYGIERDRFIARSRIILNVHFYESRLFEIVRCSYLMANRKCIVSEQGNDPDMEKDYRNAIAFAEYNELTARIQYLLDNEPVRRAFEEKAFDTFSKKSQTAILRHIL